jgi:hypothetical protein
LIWPTLFFLALALLVKRRALLADVKRAVAESGLNIQIAIFNLLLIVPLIAIASQAVHHVIDAKGCACWTPPPGLYCHCR